MKRLEPIPASDYILDDTVVFDSRCIPNSRFNNITSGCLGEILPYFSSGTLTSQIEPTTSFGSFTIGFSDAEGAGNTISDVCRANLVAKAYLFQKVDYGKKVKN